MKNTIALALIAITFAASAFARSQAMVQSQAQDFSVTAKDTRDGLVLWVKELGSGRLLFNKVINSVALNGDLNVARRAALAVTSQNSGPKMPIASGVFLITRDTLSSGIYKATVHRARPDEVRLVAPPQTPSTPPPSPSGIIAGRAADTVINKHGHVANAQNNQLLVIGWDKQEKVENAFLDNGTPVYVLTKSPGPADLDWYIIGVLSGLYKGHIYIASPGAITLDE